MLGQGRLEAYCMDGKNRQCHIRGKMRKKVRDASGGGGRAATRGREAAPRALARRRRHHSTCVPTRPPARPSAPAAPAAPPLLLQIWIAAGDIVLVSLREYQDEKGDVILKYTADEARELKTRGEIPEHITINDAAVEPAGGAEEAGGFEFGEASGSDSDDGPGGGAGKELDVDAI